MVHLAVTQKPTFVLRALVALACLLASLAASAQQSLPERELRRIVEREKTLYKAADENPLGIDRDNVEMQLREVAQDYERIIRNSPDFVPAYVAYGMLLTKVGERKKAAEYFLQANKLDPSIAIVKNQLGNYCAEEGEFQDAMEYYLSAIAIEPDEPLYHYQLGTLLHEYQDQFVAAGRLDVATAKRQSVAAFRKAAELAPDSFPYAYRYAESYYDRDIPEWREAIATWTKLRDRANPGVEQQTIDLHIANILIIQERFSDARAILSGVTDPTLKENRETLVARLPENP